MAPWRHDPGEFGVVSLPITGEAMENVALRLLIRQKLQDSRLPLNGISRIWGGPPDGEHCDACDKLITGPLLIEGIASMVAGRQSLQMHVECFALWDEERQEPRS